MPYVENMLSTGCGFFGNVCMSFALQLEREKINPGVRTQDSMYILADESGDMESQMLRGKVVTPLFEHAGASSWHGWDAAMLVMIGEHYVSFAAALVITVALVMLAVWKMARRYRQPHRRRRTSWSGFSQALGRFSLDQLSLEKSLAEDEEHGLMRDR